MVESTRTTILSVPVNITKVLSQARETPEGFIPFLERDPEMTGLQAWWRRATTPDRLGIYPFETTRNYTILGFCYLGLIALSTFGILLVLK
jgi:hypothetical protein